MKKELKEILMDGARNAGICKDGYGHLGRLSDKGAAVDYYLANPDWCIECGFPSLDVLRTEFADCEDKGVYVGRTFDGEVLRERQVYVFHACKGWVQIGWDAERAIIPMLYFANGCDMRVCGDGADRERPLRIPMYVFDGEKIEAVDGRDAEFRTHRQKK